MAFTDLFGEFLAQGQWSPSGDDNEKEEALSQDLLRQLVEAYRAHPNDRSGQYALGLFVLAMSIAEWGVRDPSGLPADPQGEGWRSHSGPNSGKHLMSYSVGGIGISHADGDEMIDFVQKICQFPQITPQQKSDLLATVEKTRYKNQKVTFDQLRASSVCRSGTTLLGKDLFGEEFKHHEIGGGASYCEAHFGSSNLTPHDWIIFKTWARIALRKIEVQQSLIDKWFDQYWSKTLRQLAPGDGFEEEAFINVRFRNSFSHAATTTSAATSGVPERIATQMRAYRAINSKRFDRRVLIIQRPVTLYRAFAGKVQLPIFRH
jgi:hypothetical protein